MLNFSKFMRNHFHGPKSRFDEAEGRERYHLFFYKDKMTFSQLPPKPGPARGAFFEELHRLYGVSIFMSLVGVSQLSKSVILTEVDTAKVEVVERVERIARIEAPYFKSPKITNMYALDKSLLLVKGTYLYDEGFGFDCDYFGILSKDKGLIIDNHTLLQVISINRRYYFVTHFQKPESCASGLVIFRLEKDGLAEAFSYCSDDLEYYKYKDIRP